MKQLWDSNRQGQYLKKFSDPAYQAFRNNPLLYMRKNYLSTVIHNLLRKRK